ncbi:MAG: hypothetical protein NTV24_04895, partial [Candidatus Woesebacteria bacterium]|nr:hypothetical protein [Candidatus Woesebacteria bacterium]
MQIRDVNAKKIKNSRNTDTIEVYINGCKASAPECKSTGKYETPPYYQSLDWNIKAIKSLKIHLNINSFADLKKLEDTIKYLYNF